MRTITTPQTRRRQTTETARARLDRLFPTDPPTAPDDHLEPHPGSAAEPAPRLGHGAENAGAAAPEDDPGGPPEAGRGVAGPAEPAESESVAAPARAAPDPGAAVARTTPSGHGGTDSPPERDPPAEEPAPDGAAAQKPFTPFDPPDDHWADSLSDPDPPPVPRPVPNPVAVPSTAPPKLPLRFRLPAAYALDRRAVLGLTVLLVLATGYAVQHFWLARPHPVAVPTIATAEAVSDRAEEGAPVPPSTSPPLVIDIAGKVQSPGLRTLPAGSRVADALTAAGGPLPGADTGLLNLARPLTDGEQILVGTDPLPGGAVPAAPTGPVSLNHAGAEQLDSLPGVGPALAQRILQYRLTHGPFQSLDQLRHVPGIGPRKYEDLKPLLTL
ncbi:helix-hairpin-helix domain-containing protein [Kitasatospora sp. NPDC001540]|uniref:helix-hairpin-helix domain-containing protein n=1 Tax=Kitasatospora sp. NPDC001540 TaxID=3364014 RepID=UPI0036CF2A39